MTLQRIKLFGLVLCALVFTGCAGVKSFPNTVQTGETVAIAAGWKKHFSRNDIQVTFTPASGPEVVYTSPDPRIRSVVNLYPDPVSSLVVTPEVGVDVTPNATTYTNSLQSGFVRDAVGDNKDYWQTVVFVDVPAISNGIATVQVSNSHGETSTTEINVLPSSGEADEFNAQLSGPLNSSHLLMMERLDHYLVSFAGGAEVPHAIELDLDYANLNSGYLIKARGDLTSLSWSDTGTGYKAILMAANQPLGSLNDYKFYVAIASGLSCLTTVDVAPGSVQAFDSSGTVIPNVTATAVRVRGAAGLYECG